MKRSRFTSEMTDKYFAFINAVHAECIKKGYCDNITAFIKDYTLSPNVTDALQDVGVLKNEPTKCSDESGRWFWIGDDPTEMMAGFIKARCNAVTRPHQKNVQTRSLPSSMKLIVAVSKTKDHTTAYVQRVEKVFNYLKKLYAIHKQDGVIYNISSILKSNCNYMCINAIIRNLGLITRTGEKGYVRWKGNEPTEEISIMIVDELQKRTAISIQKNKEKKKLTEMNSFENQARKQGYNPVKLKPIDNSTLCSSENYRKETPEPILNSSESVDKTTTSDISKERSKSPKYEISEFKKLAWLCDVFGKDISTMKEDEMKSLFESLSAIEMKRLSEGMDIGDVALR
jgi:hypothetical protein